jgi:hypothetical protein
LFIKAGELMRLARLLERRVMLGMTYTVEAQIPPPARKRGCATGAPQGSSGQCACGIRRGPLVRVQRFHLLHAEADEIEPTLHIVGKSEGRAVIPTLRGRLSMANCYFAKPDGIQHCYVAFFMLLIPNGLLVLARYRSEYIYAHSPKRLCAFLLPNETKSAEVLPAVPPGNYH